MPRSLVSDDGWFNATLAAARFGNVPVEWLRLPDTKSYIAALERKYGKIPYLKTKRGKGGGTWFHPMLAGAFVRLERNKILFYFQEFKL